MCGFVYSLAYEFDPAIKVVLDPGPFLLAKVFLLSWDRRNGSHHEFTCHVKQSEFPSEESQHLICICFQAKDPVDIGPLSVTVIIPLPLTGLWLINIARLIRIIKQTGFPVHDAVTER